MSLPAAWTDKIFTKLALAYGREFLSRWEGLDLDDVKSDWGHELAGFEAHPEAISFAFANLPLKAPTVIEFRAIARRAPTPDVPRLEAPRADPERVAAAMAQLAPARAAMPVVDHKAWAKRIVARHAAGERINVAPLRMARQALGLEA